MEKKFVRVKGKEYRVNKQKLFLFNKDIHDLSEIEGLGELTDLKWLLLTNNQISEIRGLENLVNLEYLGLGNNQVSEIRGLETLRNLKVLDLSLNPLTRLEGLDSLENLIGLYLWGTPIKRVKGLGNLVNLRNTKKKRMIGGLYLRHTLIPKPVIKALGGMSMGRARKPQRFVEHCMSPEENVSEIENTGGELLSSEDHIARMKVKYKKLRKALAISSFLSLIISIIAMVLELTILR
ncbi:MAG: leucine-rich repeat domain-containing protein [Candidatus Hodarchaeota archaeon]